MTPHSKNSTWVNAAFGLGMCLAAIGVWEYLAGSVFMALVGKKFDDAQFLTFYQYCYYYGHIKEVAKHLWTAGGITTAIFLVPILIIFAPRKKSLHGEARFASKSEIQKAGLFGENGIILGKMGKQFLTFGGQQFVMMCAPTRGGKGVSTVITNLLQWPDSVVCLDTKQENFDITSGYRAKYGQKCFLFNPAARDYRTHRWNPLGYISDDPTFRVNDIQKIGGFLFPDQDGQDPIWTASSRSLFLGVVLYITETPELPLTMGEVLRQVTRGEEAGKYFSRLIKEREETGNPLSHECVSALNDFISTSTNTRTSIRKTFSSRMELWFNPLVDAATAHNDFDLRNLRKERMSVYVGVTPDDLARMQPILNLFFQQVLDLNTQELPMRNPALKYSCLLLLDEFTAIGKIAVLNRGVSYIAGYNLRMLPIIQSPTQLRSVYGADDAKTFMDNHAAHIMFAPSPRDNETAEEIAKILGDQTWKVKNLSRKIGFSAKGEKNESASDQRRALMLPQEVKSIGPWKEFVLVENTPPIFCDKIRYFVEPVFVDRLKEVSPSLRALGKQLPSKEQLENAAMNGELRAPCPLITIAQRTEKTSGASVHDEDGGTSGKKTVEITERAMQASDIAKLDSFDANSFSCDFSDVVITGTSDAEMQAGVDDLLAKFGMTV